MITRSIKTRAELRDNRRLCWYACLFNEKATITERTASGEVVTYDEVIAPGAFTEALRGTEEVVANIDHDNQQTFAKRSDGTLLLQQDPKGLFCSCYIPDNEHGDRIIKRVEAGELDGSSFWFVPDTSRIINGVTERQSVKLIDVCLTNRPAYPQTIGEVHLRNNQQQHSRATRLKLIKIKQQLHKYK